MTSPDPTCTVNGVLPPIDVAASASLTIALASPAGVRFWSIQCTSTDELNSSATVNATLVVNQTNKTATCTLSNVLGSAYIFTSTVGILGLGLDANGIVQKAMTTTFKVNVKASNGARVLAENETFEQSAAAGWVAVVDPALRAGVSVPIAISGTGFAHVTSSSIDGSAKSVDLSSNGTGGDVTNILAWTNGGHIQGHVNVTNASPGTLDATHQIAYCDTSTGTCSATLPNAASFGGTIPADWEVLVIDTGGAAGTSAITVNPNGANIWDPSAQAFGSSNVSLATNGIASWWKWDANKSHWTLINSGGGGGAVPAPASTISSNTTITSAQQWVVFTGAGGGYTITLQNMVAGILYRLTHVGPTGIESPNTVTLSRGTATFTIESPQDRTAAAANTQVIDASYQTYHLMLDKTNNIVRCLGVS